LRHGFAPQAAVVNNDVLVDALSASDQSGLCVRILGCDVVARWSRHECYAAARLDHKGAFKR